MGKEVWLLLMSNIGKSLFLSSQIIPKHRAPRIDTIKQNLLNSEPIILISTQVVEAGVDLDFDMAVRDTFDRGYDFPEIEHESVNRGYTPHIRHRGEGRRMVKNVHRVKRWVVERTNSWHNRFRKLLVRYEKKVENYLGLVQLACCIIIYNQSLTFSTGILDIRSPITFTFLYPL